jgi:hypothetical protein
MKLFFSNNCQINRKITRFVTIFADRDVSNSYEKGSLFPERSAETGRRN